MTLKIKFIASLLLVFYVSTSAPVWRLYGMNSFTGLMCTSLKYIRAHPGRVAIAASIGTALGAACVYVIKQLWASSTTGFRRSAEPANQEITVSCKGYTVSLVYGDITTQPVDAVVNAANEKLEGGGGVDYAIHKAAGPCLLRYNKTLPFVHPGVRLPLGHVQIVPGFGMTGPAPFRHRRVIAHVNGPRVSTAGRKKYLLDCYRNALTQLSEYKDEYGFIQSVAFPSISTGIFNYPVEEAASIAMNTIIKTLNTLVAAGKTHITNVRFVIFPADGVKTFDAYRDALLAAQASLG